MSNNRRHPLEGIPGCVGLASALSMIWSMGCSSTWGRWGGNGWEADYDTAEKRMAESGRELLLFFRAADQGHPDPTLEALRGSRLRQQTAGHVRCSLFRSHEPDRRYAAQFGADRAPALIVVHLDGTYHTHTGAMSEAQISEFLNAAQPPGATPVLNPHIPRRSRYVWHTSLKSAEVAAQESGQSILVVLDRCWSRDRRKLEKLLRRREVYSRFADMVHCRPGSILGPDNDSMARFGVENLPALVIVRRDGAHQVLELPTSYQAIVRFADRGRSSGGEGAWTAATAPRSEQE